MNKRILIFTDWYLPGHKAGGPVTSLAALTGYLDKVEFYILTRNTDYCEHKPYSDIQPDKWIKREKNTHVYYFSEKNLNRKNISNALSGLTFDTWYINGIYSWYFSIYPLWLSRFINKGKVIVAPRGMLSAHALEVKPFKKKLFLRLAKTFNLYRSTIFHATFPGEEKNIRHLFPSHPVYTFANLSRHIHLPESTVSLKKPGALMLFSLARVSPEKNTLGALSFLKELGKTLNGKTDYSVQFDLYGHIYNVDYFNECSKIANEMPGQIKINFHNSVPPEEIAGKISAHHFLLMPSHGENFGHAIMESLSSGKPVLISDQTPWKNLRKHSCGWDISTDNNNKFVSSLMNCLLMDSDEYEKMSRSARTYASENQDTERIIKGYLQLFFL